MIAKMGFVFEFTSVSYPRIYDVDEKMVQNLEKSGKKWSKIWKNQGKNGPKFGKIGENGFCFAFEHAHMIAKMFSSLPRLRTPAETSGKIRSKIWKNRGKFGPKI